MPEEQSLSSSISNYARSHGARVCGVQRALNSLSGIDLEDLNQALKDRSITNRSIALALADRDIEMTVDILKRHRRGECSCES
jgi:hypothetical protein